MDNPYKPSRAELNDRRSLVRRAHAGYVILYGVAGAFGGFIAFTILANMETWPLYTIRSTLTGESAMSRIVAHPADRWICLGLLFVAVLGGALLGFRFTLRKP